MRELSIIVPVLNEAAALPDLLRSLAGQQGVEPEVIICDGGSDDGTPELAISLGHDLNLPIHLISTAAGRARQMNAGAAAGIGRTFLFLHADSIFPDSHALRKGLEALDAAVARRGDKKVAGRFRLRFHRQESIPSAGHYHFECKARLDRRECIHGDQGFLLRSSFFQEAGPFDEGIPMLAETRFAEKVRGTGEWLLLPAEIHTSARRFETEGLRERQTVNAIVMNFAAAGWETFFRDMPGIYRTGADPGQIDLHLFLKRTESLMAALPGNERRRLWAATGRYVRDNAWQIPLALDTLHNFRRRVPAGAGKLRMLKIYDRYLDRLTDHPPGRLAATIGTWLWFRQLLFWGGVEKKGST